MCGGGQQPVFNEVTNQKEGWWICADRCVSFGPLYRDGPVFLCEHMGMLRKLMTSDKWDLRKSIFSFHAVLLYSLHAII